MNSELVSVVGLGYVGLPLAVEFAAHGSVIGYDHDAKRIESLTNGVDVTESVDEAKLRNPNLRFTADPHALGEAAFHVIAVPTPLGPSNHPDLGPLEKASRDVGRNLRKGATVVIESTVYPGVTEDTCMPIFEKESGLKCDADFHLAYSPERINPGDNEHTLSTIPKVISARTPSALERVAEVYGRICPAGLVRASSIRAAEAAKIIENTQRDLNVALMNEFAMILHLLDIDVHEVLKVAATKWNFLRFVPGLVGGHCIGVDPRYLAHKAEEVGFHPQVILAGRRTNDSMGKYVAEATVKMLIRARKTVWQARVAVLGLTFKENVPDLRNSRVLDIVNELRGYDVSFSLVEPAADPGEVEAMFGQKPVSLEELPRVDAIIMAVSHREFKDLGDDWLRSRLTDPPVMIDVKALFRDRGLASKGFRYWSL